MEPLRLWQRATDFALREAHQLASVDKSYSRLPLQIVRNQAITYLAVGREIDNFDAIALGALALQIEDDLVRLTEQMLDLEDHAASRRRERELQYVDLMLEMIDKAENS